MKELKRICIEIIDGDWIESKDQSSEGIRLVQTGNIGYGIYLSKNDKAKFITEDTFNRLKCSEIFQGDVLISRLPSPVGRACVFPNIEKRAITAVDCTIVRLNKEICIPKYFVYYTMSDLYSRQVDKFVVGTTRLRISRKNLESIKIFLPSLDVQNKIVEVLDKSQELIAKRKAQIEALDELVKSRFIEMFGDPLSNSKKYNFIKLYECVKEKNDLVDGPFGSSVNTKVDYIENGEIPVIRTKNVNMMEFNSNDLKFMTREKYKSVIRSQVLPGDVILTKVGTIGNLCIFPDSYQEAVLSTTGSCRIRVNEEKINKLFFAYYLIYYRDKLLDIASAGVQPFLNMNHIKNLNIFDVEYEVQNKFADFVNQVDKLKFEMEKGLKELEDNFNSLMQKAFSGELFS